MCELAVKLCRSISGCVRGQSLATAPRDLLLIDNDVAITSDCTPLSDRIIGANTVHSGAELVYPLIHLSRYFPHQGNRFVNEAPE
jgi:hypothetical protein